MTYKCKLELKDWITILEERGYEYKSKCDKTEHHKCNPFQFLKLDIPLSNDTEHQSDFKITVMNYDAIQIEAYVHRYFQWETIFHGVITSTAAFDLLIALYLSNVNINTVSSKLVVDEIKLLINQIKSY